MTKIKYSDDTFAVINYEETSPYGKFTRYMPSEGKFVLLLPFLRIKNKNMYLGKKQRIYAWDSHADNSSLTMPLKYHPEVTACHIAKAELGLNVKESELIHLGMTFASKYSGDSHYLFALRLEKKDVISDELLWLSYDEVVEGVDPLFMMAVNRLEMALR